MKHSDGPWTWGKDADELDDRDFDAAYDEENSVDKYMDGQLYDRYGNEIIPVRVDNRQMVYDGDWISKADRNLIAAAPELLNMLQEVIDNWPVLDREDYVRVSCAIERAIGD